jgi:DNA helicase HerA-like ATPase
MTHKSAHSADPCSTTQFGLLETDDGHVKFAEVLPRANIEPILHIADHPISGPVTFKLNGDRFRTQGYRLILIGSSGSGKSYALAVIAEEVHRIGYPFLVFDQESEFAGLAALPGVELIEIEDLGWDPIGTVNFILHEGGAAVLDVGELTLDAQRNIFHRLARDLYTIAAEIKRRCFLFVDEAAEIAPQRKQQSAASSREWLERLARRGRKRGINWVLATQRPGDLSKSVFAQVNVKLLGRVEILNDYDAIKPYLSRHIPLAHLARLDAGHFILDLAGVSEVVHIRPRQTQDLGWTPTE